MAKTISISDDVYNELKKIKGKAKSFSRVIIEILKKPQENRKTVGNLLKVAGGLKGDKEYDEVLKGSKRMWEKTDERLWRSFKN